MYQRKTLTKEEAAQLFRAGGTTIKGGIQMEDEHEFGNDEYDSDLGV